jgi:hypothetical protein
MMKHLRTRKEVVDQKNRLKGTYQKCNGLLLPNRQLGRNVKNLRNYQSSNRSRQSQTGMFTISISGLEKGICKTV